MNKYNEYNEYLVPCNCGGKVELTGGTYGYPTFGIRCLKCGGQWSMDTYSVEEAVEKWGLKYIPLKVLEHFKKEFDEQDGQKYPCSNQIVLCGIITKDKEKAIAFMKDKNVVKIRERKNEITWYLDNGEKWMWQNWNINHRGYRFYKIAVDKFIDINLFRYLVVPKCNIYCCSFDII